MWKKTPKAKSNAHPGYGLLPLLRRKRDVIAGLLLERDCVRPVHWVRHVPQLDVQNDGVQRPDVELQPLPGGVLDHGSLRLEIAHLERKNAITRM